MKKPKGRTPAWVPEGRGAMGSVEVPGVVAPARRESAPRSREVMDPAALAEGVLAGRRGELARAITLVESNAARHRPAAREILRRIRPPARPTRRIGISGIPGVGKSTFIEAFGNFLCDCGHRVAVLAVDPSSPVSGGSILGDKTRMETLSRREECFIRPSPSGGVLGGVARKTRETMLLCEAAGYDIILVETVGVGQSEITVRSMVDCFLLLMIAGAGDELQGIKKGILEIADVFAINKTDGANRERAQAARSELDRALRFMTPFTPGWTPPVLAISSTEGFGVADLWQGIEAFANHTRASGQDILQRREQDLAWWQSLVEQELRARAMAHPRLGREAQSLEERVRQGALSPSLAAEELLACFEELLAQSTVTQGGD